MTMENDLASALDGIADPLTGKGLLAANRLPPPVIRGGVATLVLAVDGLSGDAVSQLETRIREAGTGVAGVRDIRIVRTAERRQRRLIAVARGKGGVGKSTVAANLAEIGRASCRERVCQNVLSSGVAGPLKKQKLTK